jgi:hypothetical protein
MLYSEYELLPSFSELVELVELAELVEYYFSIPDTAIHETGHRHKLLLYLLASKIVDQPNIIHILSIYQINITFYFVTRKLNS